MAQRLGLELAAKGFTVVSGLARGIDGEAHQGALDAHGKTLAVLGCGVDVIYPAEHRKLAEAIIDGRRRAHQRAADWNAAARRELPDAQSYPVGALPWAS